MIDRTSARLLPTACALFSAAVNVTPANATPRARPRAVTMPPDRTVDEQDLRLELASGITIRMTLLRRPGRDVLVVLPGFWRTRRSRRIRALADRLAILSSVAVVDLRGHGDSTGTYTFGTHEPADVCAVLRHLRELGYTRIGLLGLSLGGTIGMEALRNLPRGLDVLGAALVSAPTEVRRARPMFLSPKALRQLQPREVARWPRFSLRYLLDRHQRASRDRPKGESFPVALFHCRRDWLIPDTEASAWAEDLGARAQLQIFEDGRRLHADALLGGDIPLADLLAQWWLARIASPVTPHPGR